MKPETKWRTTVVDPFLKKLENTYVMSIQQASLVGDADKILCVNGLFVAIELKFGKNKESALQKYKRQRINEVAGGIAVVAHPSNWGSIKAFLTALSKGIKHDKHQIS